jgi:hypothetical protein
VLLNKCGLVQVDSKFSGFTSDVTACQQALSVWPLGLVEGEAGCDDVQKLTAISCRSYKGAPQNFTDESTLVLCREGMLAHAHLILHMLTTFSWTYSGWGMIEIQIFMR